MVSRLLEHAHDLAADRGADDALAALAAELGFGPIDAVTEAHGTISARVVVRAVPRIAVEQLLPRGIQIAPQPLCPSAWHPVFVVLSRNRFGAWFGAMDYHEAMVGVPYVELAEPRSPCRGPFIYMPRLYLDADVPRRLGVHLYGFEKREGTHEISPGRTRWVVRDSADQDVLSASFADDGAADAPDRLANFAWVRKLFEMPTVSQALRIVDAEALGNGAADQWFLGSTVRYLFDEADAQVRPLRAELQFGAALTPPGLPLDRHAAPSLREHVLGAFELSSRAIVSLPSSLGRATMPPGRGRKLRVAVLGGGPAGCSAAFWLANQGGFDVDLYTAGWRMGGKCAASRNANHGDRIEEHGLHALLGFYENTFRSLREVYRVAGREISSDEGPVAGAVRAHPPTGVMAQWRGDRWRYFPSIVFEDSDTPGDVPGADVGRSIHVGAALLGLLRRAGRDAVEATAGDEVEDTDHLGAGWRDAIDRLQDGIASVTGAADRVVAGLREWIGRQSAIEVENAIEAGGPINDAVIAMLETTRTTLGWALRGRAKRDPDSWFRWSGIDTLLTIAIGLLRERCLDFERLDDRDLVAWLVGHGLAPEHADAVVITHVYETLFAHRRELPVAVGELAAGVGLRWFLLEGFGYSGSPVYEMRWAASETLITPYYEALQRLGARVHFFHAVRSLEIAGEGVESTLARVTMQVQARTKSGDPYAPLVSGPAGAPARWPAAPLWDQLEHGDVLRARDLDFEDGGVDVPGSTARELAVGRDVDAVILAIPLGALRPLVADWARADGDAVGRRWHAMLDGISLTRTMSAQLWWDLAPEDLFQTPRGLMTGYAQPQPSVGNFPHLVAVEDWPAPRPKTVTYHTGAGVAGERLAVPYASALAAEASAQWRVDFAAWLAEHHRDLFDGFAGTFAELLARLHDDEGAPGLARLQSQWFSIANRGSDLYVLSRPGEMQLRMGQADAQIRGLILAGDWTKTDLNCGCVEAATQSGMLAARVLGGQPAYVWRIGF